MVDSQPDRGRLLAQPSPKPIPALFLNCDGVLIENKNRLYALDELVLCGGTKSLIRQPKQQHWPVAVITSQSGIARGYFDWEAYKQVSDHLFALLGFAAPSSWRKPSSAMLQAAAGLQMDHTQSPLISNPLLELETGGRAGLNWMTQAKLTNTKGKN